MVVNCCKDCLLILFSFPFWVIMILYSYTCTIFFSDRTIKVWNFDGLSDDIEEPISLKAKAVVAAHDKDINSLAVAPNDSLVCSGSQVSKQYILINILFCYGIIDFFLLLEEAETTYIILDSCFYGSKDNFKRLNVFFWLLGSYCLCLEASRTGTCG